MVSQLLDGRFTGVDVLAIVLAAGMACVAKLLYHRGQRAHQQATRELVALRELQPPDADAILASIEWPAGSRDDPAPAATAYQTADAQLRLYRRLIAERYALDPEEVVIVGG